METLELARTIALALEEKKGEDILVLDIRELADFAEYFVICTGTSDRMLNALADDVMEKMRPLHLAISRKEGAPENGWVLVDFGDVILHLFSPDRRSYYRLEDLWSKGKVVLRFK